MATFTATQTGSSADYLRYVYGGVTKTDTINAPSLLDFSLLPIDSSFVRLQRGAYIKIQTSTYGVWYTGFITNDPELAYIGSSKGNGVWGYTYQASGDQYLLNLKPIGIVPAFINTTQGTILKYLIDLLTPAGWDFDVSGITDGTIIARYVIDPNKTFYDVVKDFTQNSNYQFDIVNKAATYRQQDTVPAGIVVDGASKHFTPSALSLKPLTDPVINDVIILGDIAPQGYMTEYFVGDGITSAFPLSSAVWGVDSTTLLDDAFGSSTIDTTKWTLYDTPAAFIQPINGFINTFGGTNDNTFSVMLQSQSLLPLEGNLRITHGEYDIVSPSDGVIGGVWQDQPLADLSNCVYGLRILKGVGGTTYINPLSNGVVDTTQHINLDLTKRYILRTLFNFQETIRQSSEYSYLDSTGVVGSYGGTAEPNGIGTAQTLITEVDPTTGVITEQYTLNNNLTGAPTYAYYCPVVLNDLHCSFTGVTISTPMQTTLAQKPLGSSTYTPQLMGANEIDSYDGYAPVATIIDSIAGLTSKSTTLGTSTYNPGQATLTYFKDTVRQIAQAPPVGSLVRLTYRIPGAAIGRIQDRSSLLAEAAAFGDDGLRTLVKSDMSPLPRTEQEAEFAAAAMVKYNAYQHYQGNYKMPSGAWFTAQPTAGSILTFANLSASFPATLKAEAVTQVKTTFDHLNGGEYFTHDMTFGKIDLTNQFLSSLPSLTDVFVPQDTVEIPKYADIRSIGLTKAVDVPSPTLTSFDNTSLTFNANIDPPVGGGFEVRYTDESWGADEGKNLAGRFTTRTFTVPRTAYARVAFVKAYDSRNQILWAEDLTQSPWHTLANPATVTTVSDKDPDNSHARLSQVILGAAESTQVSQITDVPMTLNQNASLSLSLFGTKGKTVTAKLIGNTGDVFATLTITLTGYWQRVTLSAPITTPVPGTITSTFIGVGFTTTDVTDTTVLISRVSLELDATFETAYCKTNGTKYGALSRNSSGIRIGLPLIPPAPTATLSFTSPSSPVVTVDLPTVLVDVWGLEIRDADNTTVLTHQDLTVSGYFPVVAMPQVTGRSTSYYVYTYNLLGEYSSSYNVANVIPTPTVLGMTLDNQTKTLVWTSSNSPAFRLEIDTVDNTFAHKVVDQNISSSFFMLSDADFFEPRWVRLTPLDQLGNGTAVVENYSYIPEAVDQLTSNEVAVVVGPSTSSASAIVVPSNFAGFAGEYHHIASTNYQANVSGNI